MFRYIAAGLLFVIGFFEIALALNKRLREEIIKNSPLPLSPNAPWFFFLAALSAFGIGLGILFSGRLF
ncbi:MAG: hypothetical protein ABJB97_04140 [Acidobacteriota bacterium]